MTAGAFDTTRNGEFDAFVTKLNAAGSALVYSTYLGGSLVDMVTVDRRRCVGQCLRGWLDAVSPISRRRPAPSTRRRTASSTPSSTKLNAAGSALVYSTFLGGSGFDRRSGLAVDAAGNAYVVGRHGLARFPDDARRIRHDVAAAASSRSSTPPASALVYSTFLGGASASGVVVDGTGNAWFTGGSRP